MRGMRLLASWVLALFLVFMILQATVHPLPNPPDGSVLLFDRPGENIVFQTLATNTGMAWLEPTGRALAAILLLFAGILMLIPYSRRSGAIIVFLVMVGFVAAHMTPGFLGREVPAALGSSDDDGGRHFTLIIAMLAVSVLLVFIHPGKRKNPFR